MTNYNGGARYTRLVRQVLVPRCVFTAPGDARRAEAAQRVRSFSSAQLAEGARAHRWDRVRVLCSQPYNRHCQFGLSFIHIYEPEEASATPSALSAPGLRNKIQTLGSYSSDEDEYRPGELFAKHRQSLAHKDDTAQNISTDAQIRQASSQALKNIPDAAAKLKKASIARGGGARADPCRAQPADRGRESLLYEPGDSQPHAAIDRVLASHQHQKKKPDESENRTPDNKKAQQKAQAAAEDATISPKPSRSGAHARDGETRAGGKRRRTRAEAEEGSARAEAAAVLRGVVFAMSGYVNPERAALRDAGLALGARYCPDWTPSCTHLVCAFPNTPKMKQVLSSAAHAHVVGGAWLRDCRAQRRRLPESRYALHAPRRAAAPPPPGATRAPPDPRSDCSDKEGDTDDEIEKVRARNKRARVHSPPSDDDVTFVRDDRIKGSVALDDSDDGESTEPEGGCGEPQDETADELPDLLRGRSVLLADEVRDVGFDALLLARYVRAYGGQPLREAELEEGAAVDYVLCTGGGGAARVSGVRLRPDWLWRCHELRALAPHHQYELPAPASLPDA
ncbi:DNA repair protein XRCC1-like isoform X2 [Battus philenor]|uniref:DNA repair protein XRCC1-like isoform X2 n=1 Tax=Battus philenor TaxID=42288 RepID=UPI0035D076FB